MGTPDPIQPGTEPFRINGIDGVRAFAVLAVIAAHAHVAWLHGGGIGVDMFFGISGFLIAFLLLREGSTTWHIDSKKFWLRRVLRPYPALLVLVAAIDLFALLSRQLDQNPYFNKQSQQRPQYCSTSPTG